MLHSRFWHIHSAGCWCVILRTIKVVHGVDGHRVPRHPRNLAVHQTARKSCSAVCTTDGWSVELISFFFPLPGAFIVSHHHTHLRVMVCFISLCVWKMCICSIRMGYAAGKREHISMVFDLEYVWAHEILMEHFSTKRTPTQFSTKQTESVFKI